MRQGDNVSRVRVAQKSRCQRCIIAILIHYKSAGCFSCYTKSKSSLHTVVIFINLFQSKGYDYGKIS